MHTTLIYWCSEECDELSVIALEEQHGNWHMYLKEGDKLAEFVCAATFDTDSDTNINHYNY